MAKVKCDGNHDGPPCSNPECWSAPRNNPGLVGEIPPLKITLLPEEAAYLARVVSADYQRMTEARDHGVSHGMRGYAPPDLEPAGLILHSLAMARTAATIEAIEALEEQRQDTAILAGDQDNKPHGSPA
jgi:hypothetical protein